MEKRSIAKWCLGLITFSAAGFSFATLLYGISEVLSGGTDLAVGLGALVFFLMLVVVFSLATFKIFSKKKVLSDPQELEFKTLSFAQSKDGFVAVADLALHENISIDDAGKTLDELVLKNVARVEVSSSGKLAYVFDAFIGASETKEKELQLAIENANAATANLKKKRAAEEAAAEAAEVEEVVEIQV